MVLFIFRGINTEDDYDEGPMKSVIMMMIIATITMTVIMRMTATRTTMMSMAITNRINTYDNENGQETC